MKTLTYVTRALRYLRDAAELRASIEYSLLDRHFAQNKGQIVYLMDANVVGIFLAPASEAAKVTPFANEVGGSLAPTALVMAEYLFSRELPGQGDLPALMTPGHGDDLSSILEGLRKRAAGQEDHIWSNEAAVEEARAPLQSIVDAILSGQIVAEAAYDQLREKVPTLARTLLESPFAAATQFLRLYEEDRLRPLELHRHASREILHPPESDIKDWLKTIHEERVRTQKIHQDMRATSRRSVGGRPRWRESPQHRIEKDRRDAKSLVQIKRLNEAAAQERRLRRYVLVSGDKVLHRDYAGWFWSKENPNQDPKSYFLRHPFQYLPILGDANGEPLILQIRDALDSLLTNLRPLDSNYPHALMRLSPRILANNLASVLWEEDDPTLKSTLELWQRSFQGGVVQNANLLARRVEAEFSKLASVLASTQPLRVAIFQHQQDYLRAVEAEHLKFGTRINLRALQRMGAAAIRGPARGPFTVHVDISHFAGAQPVRMFIEGILNDDAALDRLVIQMDRSDDFRAMFIGAAVAFRCALWRAARRYSRRAIAFLPDTEFLCETEERTEDVRQELLHLIAVATRFSLRTPDDFAEADSILVREAEYFGDMGDDFRQARALSECATLHWFAAWRQRILPDPALYPIQPKLSHDLGAISAKLRNTSSDNQRLSSEGMWHDPYKLVSMQHNANIVSAELLRRLSSAEVEPVDKESLDAALRALESYLASGQYPRVLGAGVRLLRWMDSTSPNSKARIAAELVSDCEEAANEFQAGEITELDRAELRYFAKWLRSRSSS